MTDHTINVETGNIFISPLGWAGYAKDFYKMAESYNDSSIRSNPAKTFSCGRAIESILKAYLFAEGLDKQQLKALSHKLHSKIYTECLNQGIDSHIQLTAQEEQLLKDLETWVVEDFGMYFDVEGIFNAKEVPLEKVMQLTKKLIDIIYPYTLQIAQNS